MNEARLPEVIVGQKMSDYLALKRFSSGLAHRLMAYSPLHARLASPWNASRDTDSSNAADTGSAAHKMLLEGTEDGIQVIEADDWRTKAAKELRDAAYVQGRIPMLVGKMDAVRSMVEVARSYIARSELKGVLDDGEPEVTLLFDLDGLPCKARCDRLTTDRRICLSYKTTQGSANPDSWIRTQLPQYDIATVFYEMAVMLACKAEQTTCVHLIQEQQFPHACSLVALSPAYHDLAAHRMDMAVATWKACEASGKWPAYPTRICHAEPKPWQQAEAEERQNDDSAFFKDEELNGGIPL